MDGVLVAGFDRSFNSRHIPAVRAAVDWLRESGYTALDVRRSDDIIGQDDQPSSAFRAEALINDVILLTGAKRVALVHGWDRTSEGRAIKAMAEALNKEVMLLPEIRSN